MNMPAVPNPPSSPLPPPLAAPAYYGGAPAGAYSGEPPQSDAGPLNAMDPLRLIGIVRKKWLTILLAALFAVLVLLSSLLLLVMALSLSLAFLIRASQV